MGTSKDYGGGTGGAWKPYKQAVNVLTRHGSGTDGVRLQKVLARYVAARGGAAAIAGGPGGTAAISAGQGVAQLASQIASSGLTPALERLGFGNLVGKDRYELLDGLIEALGGDGGTLDDQAVLSAVIASLEHLFPEDLDSYEDLDSITMDSDGLRALVEDFVAEWAYYEMAPTFAEKFTHIEDANKVRQIDDELRAMIRDLVQIETEGQDTLDVDWSGDEGRTIVRDIVTKLYSVVEEDLEP